MEFLFFFVFMILGLLIGFIGAFVGVGGGILSLLIFIFLAESQGLESYQSTRMIIANTALILFVLQLILAIKRITNRKFYLQQAMTVAIPAMLITIGISYVILNYDIISLNTFKIILIIFASYSSYILVTNKERRLFDVCHRGGIRRNIRNSFSGVLSGIATSITGSDSGIFIVPILNRYCDIDIRKAVNIYNTSLLFVLITIIVMYGYPILNNKGIAESDYLGFFYTPYIIPLLIGVSIAALPGYTLFNKLKFNYFAYPLVFIFAVTVLRILFSDFIFPLYR